MVLGDFFSQCLEPADPLLFSQRQLFKRTGIDKVPNSCLLKKRLSNMIVPLLQGNQICKVYNIVANDSGKICVRMGDKIYYLPG